MEEKIKKAIVEKNTVEPTNLVRFKKMFVISSLRRNNVYLFISRGGNEILSKRPRQRLSVDL